jgi:hypothetical protein
MKTGSHLPAATPTRPETSAIFVELREHEQPHNRIDEASSFLMHVANFQTANNPDE